VSQLLEELLGKGSLLVLPVALVAGLISGLNPCCLPIYPAAAGCCGALRRETVSGNLGIAALFVLGGSLTTTALGVVSALAGEVFGRLGSWPAYVIAAVPIVFGLHLVGVISIPLPADPTLKWSPKGPLGAVTAGVLLGCVIIPCATPVLAGLLAYVAGTGNPVWGGLTLFVFGIGIGLPVLLVGTGAGWIFSRSSRVLQRRTVDIGSGIILVLVGLYLLWIA
jgi:cytochrome c-type biogenesis protein